jgi:hypothetical protein
MSMVPVAAKPSGMPTWLKLTLGCGLVIGLIAFVVFGMMAYGFYWVVSPGEQTPTRTVISPRSAAVVQAGDLSQKAGVRDFLQHLLAESQRIEKENGAPELPPFLEGMRQWQQAQAGQSLAQWMPRELTVSFEPAGDGGTVQAVTAVNFRQFVRPIRYFIEKTAAQGSHQRVVPHRGQSILAFEKNAVCFREGTVIFAADVDAVRGVLDRSATAAHAPAGTDDLESLRGQWDLSGRTTSSATTVTLLVLLGVPAGQIDATNAPASTRFGIDLQSADAARGFVELAYPSPAAAVAAAGPITTALSTPDWLRKSGVHIQWTSTVDGPHVKLEGHADGLAAAMTHSMEESRRRQAARRRNRYRDDN